MDVEAASKVEKPASTLGSRVLKGLIIAGLLGMFGIVGVLVGMHLSGGLSSAQTQEKVAPDDASSSAVKGLRPSQMDSGAQLINQINKNDASFGLMGNAIAMSALAKSDIVDNVVDGIQDTADTVKDVIDGVSNLISDVVNGDVMGDLNDLQLPEITDAEIPVPDIGDGLGDVGDAMGDVAGDVADGLGDVAGNVGDAVGDVAGDVADGLGEVGEGLGDASQEIVEGLGEVGEGLSEVGEGVGEALGAMGDAAADLGEGLGDAMGDMGDAIADMADGMGDGLGPALMLSSLMNPQRQGQGQGQVPGQVQQNGNSWNPYGMMIAAGGELDDFGDMGDFDMDFGFKKKK